MPELFGLSETGFKAKDLTTIKQELEAALVREVDPGLQFGPGSVAGVLTGIVANQAGQVWESLQGLYHSLQPQTASGNALDALCSLTGTFRTQADKSRVTVVLTLEPHARVPKNSRMQTIGGHNFIIRDEVVNDSPTLTNIEAECIAEEVGPIIAHADTVAKIMTPVSGWSKAVFKTMLHTGRLKETDNELRISRLTELKAKGSSTLDAVGARLRQIKTVEAVYIKESSHSFEVVIKGGQEQEIAQTIWDAKPLGVQTMGAISCLVKDGNHEMKTVSFSRPAVIELQLTAKLLVQRALNDADRNSIKNALADFAYRNFTLGSEIYPSHFYSVLLTQPLVLDVVKLTLTEKSTGKAPPSEVKSDQMATLPFNNIVIEP